MESKHNDMQSVPLDESLKDVPDQDQDQDQEEKIATRLLQSHGDDDSDSDIPSIPSNQVAPLTSSSTATITTSLARATSITSHLRYVFWGVMIVLFLLLLIYFSMI
ncbi:MAG TPA: hypothetical protein VEF04_20290 [Blastocatellia bacterium]|nr:hypothetical protein [Blastocatellia bacterium]